MIGSHRAAQGSSQEATLRKRAPTTEIHRSTMGEDLTRTPTLTTSGGSRNCRRRKLGTRRVPEGGGSVADRRTCRRPLHEQPPEEWLTKSRRTQPEGPGARAPNETRHTHKTTDRANPDQSPSPQAQTGHWVGSGCPKGCKITSHACSSHLSRCNVSPRLLHAVSLEPKTGPPRGRHSHPPCEHGAPHRR